MVAKSDIQKYLNLGWVEGISSCLKILKFPYTVEEIIYWPVNYNQDTDDHTIINKNDLINKLKNRIIISEDKK